MKLILINGELKVLGTNAAMKENQVEG